MTIVTSNKAYKDGDVSLEGFLAKPKEAATKLPAVILYPAFWGRSPHEEERARILAKLGFVAFVADPYGKGVKPSSREEAFKTLMPFLNEREKLLKPRILAAFEFVKSFPEVDKTKINAIGFCFGGLCSLDLARLNCGIKAAVSFHGALRPITKDLDHAKLPPISASLLVCHGDSDQHVNEEVPGFLDEMRKRKADFQFIAYSKAEHGFTMKPEPNAPAHVGYNKEADDRSFKAMLVLFNELYGIPIPGKLNVTP